MSRTSETPNAARLALKEGSLNSVVCQCQQKVFGGRQKTCGHTLAIKGHVKCPRCSNKHQLTDLLLTDIGTMEPRLDNAISILRNHFWENAVLNKARETILAVEYARGSVPSALPNWVSVMLYLIWQHRLVPFYLPRLRHWVFAERDLNQPMLFRVLEIEKRQITMGEIPEILEKIANHLGIKSEAVGLPTFDTAWQDVQIAKRIFWGKKLSATIPNWDSETQEWIGVPGNYALLKGGVAVEKFPHEDEVAGFTPLIIELQ